jgi:hypothetical protein
MALHPNRTWRNAAFAAVVAGSSLLAGFSAAAQQTALTNEQCQNAISISTQIMTKYRGQISEKLAKSFGQFRDSKCDLSTSFSRVEGTADEKAFGEFRLKLIALRTADISRPPVLAKQ